MRGIVTITFISHEGIPGRLAPFVWAYQEFSEPGPNITRARYDADTKQIRWVGPGMFDPDPAKPPHNAELVEAALRGFVEANK